MEDPTGSGAHARAFEYYPPLKRVDEYVRVHLAEPISLCQIAGVAHLEPKYFSRFFHDRVGLTFTEWLAARRVEHAAALLRERDRPVGEVAQQAGFRTCRACDRWFKRFKGVTPFRYKQMVRPR
jgi:AraC-like DNA-binding protein